MRFRGHICSIRAGGDFALFDAQALANSPDEWIALARRHERAACILAQHRTDASLAWDHAGFAVECALKACIMSKERLNRWPDRDEDPSLHDHRLVILARRLGVDMDHEPAVRVSWQVWKRWKRQHCYNPHVMPRKVARGAVKAASETGGVIPWLIENYL